MTKSILTTVGLLLISTGLFAQHQFGVDIGPRLMRYAGQNTPASIKIKRHLSASIGIVGRYDINSVYYAEAGVYNYSNHVFFEYTSPQNGLYFNDFSLAVERGMQFPITLIRQGEFNKTYGWAVGGGFAFTFNRKIETDSRQFFSETNFNQTERVELDVIGSNQTGGSASFLALAEGRYKISEGLTFTTRLVFNAPFSAYDRTRIDLYYFDGNGTVLLREPLAFRSSNPAFNLYLGFRYSLGTGEDVE